MYKFHRCPEEDTPVTSENLPTSASSLVHTGAVTTPLCPLPKRKARVPNKTSYGTHHGETANNTCWYILPTVQEVIDGKSPQRSPSAGAWCLPTLPGRSLGAEQHDVASPSREPGPWLSRPSTLLSTMRLASVEGEDAKGRDIVQRLHGVPCENTHATNFASNAVRRATPRRVFAFGQTPGCPNNPTRNQVHIVRATLLHCAQSTHTLVYRSIRQPRKRPTAAEKTATLVEAQH